MMNRARLDYLKDRHLRLLTALEEERQVGRAAARVGISQPAATKALKEIEDRVGVQLFIRGAHGTAPTEAGRLLVGYARHCLGATHRVTEELKVVAEHGHHILRVGMLASAAATLVPAAVTELLVRCPRTEIALQEGVMSELIEKLQRSDVDVIVGRIDGAKLPAFEEVLLVEEPLTIVARPGHPLLERGPVSTADLCRYPWILPLQRTAMREEVDRVLSSYLRSASAIPIESNSPIAYVDLLRQSDRLAVMSHGVACKWAAAGLLVIVPLEVDFHPRAVGVMYRHDETHFHAIAEFIEVLRAQM